MKHFTFFIPCWIHRRMTMHGYDQKDAIKRFKRQHGIVKMPNGYKVWEVKV